MSFLEKILGCFKPVEGKAEKTVDGAKETVEKVTDTVEDMTTDVTKEGTKIAAAVETTAVDTTEEVKEAMN